MRSALIIHISRIEIDIIDDEHFQRYHKLP